MVKGRCGLWRHKIKDYIKHRHTQNTGMMMAWVIITIKMSLVDRWGRTAEKHRAKPEQPSRPLQADQAHSKDSPKEKSVVVARGGENQLRSAMPSRVPNYLEVKKEDHTIRYVLLFMLGFVLVLFLVDLRHEIGREQHVMEIANQHCYQEYQLNECESPVEAMAQRCQQLQLCFTRKGEHVVRLMVIAPRLLGRAVQAFIQETTTLGVLFFLLLVAVFLVYAYKSSQAHVIIKAQ